jgi:murein DD-endopeptidase MepM/ murein hydrolase activator NlpD
MSRAKRMLAALPSRWPVQGPVNSEFGRRQSPWTGGNELHAGIDIGATPGVAVHAPSSGTVTTAGYLADYGLTVTIDHGADIKTVYGHLSKVQVTVGQRVDRGTVIGRTGNTGRSSGPHLHYEILVRGEPVNPRVFLWD